VTKKWGGERGDKGVNGGGGWWAGLRKKGNKKKT